MSAEPNSLLSAYFEGVQAAQRAFYCPRPIVRYDVIRSETDGVQNTIDRDSHTAPPPTLRVHMPA